MIELNDAGPLLLRHTGAIDHIHSHKTGLLKKPPESISLIVHKLTAPLPSCSMQLPSQIDY